MKHYPLRTRIKWYFWRTVFVLLWMGLFFGVGGILERII